MKSKDPLRTGKKDILEVKNQLAASGIETVPLSTLPLPLRKASAFNIVTFYEDFASAARACKAFDSLARNFCNDLPDLSSHATLWSFGMLGMSGLTTAIFQLSASADVLVVSANGDKDLPPHIAKWVERCISREPNAKPVLVALVDDELEANGSAAPLLLSLLQIANRRQARFLCNTGLKEDLERYFPAELGSDGSSGPVRETISHLAIRAPAAMQNQRVIGLDSTLTPAIAGQPG